MHLFSLFSNTSTQQRSCSYPTTTVYVYKKHYETATKIEERLQVKMFGIDGVFWILRDFRELSFLGPCGPCVKNEQGLVARTLWNHLIHLLQRNAATPKLVFSVCVYFFKKLKQPYNLNFLN